MVERTFVRLASETFFCLLILCTTTLSAYTQVSLTEEIESLVCSRDARLRSLSLAFKSTAESSEENTWACEGQFAASGDHYMTEFTISRRGAPIRTEHITFDGVSSTRLITAPGAKPSRTTVQGPVGVGTYMPLNFGLLNVVEPWSHTFKSRHRMKVVGEVAVAGTECTDIIFERLGPNGETVEFLSLAFDPKTLLFMRKTSYVSVADLPALRIGQADAAPYVRIISGKKYFPYIVNEVLESAEVAPGLHVAIKGQQSTPLLPTRPNILTTVVADSVEVNSPESDRHFPDQEVSPNDLDADDVKVLIVERDAQLRSLFLSFRSVAETSGESAWACDGWWVSQGARYVTEHTISQDSSPARFYRVVYDGSISTRLSTAPGSEPKQIIVPGYVGIGTYMPTNFGLSNIVEPWSLVFRTRHQLKAIGEVTVRATRCIDLVLSQLGEDGEILSVIGLAFDPKTLLFLRKTSYISFSEFPAIGALPADAERHTRVVHGVKYIPLVVNEVLSSAEVAPGLHVPIEGRQSTPLTKRPPILTTVNRESISVNDAESDEYFVSKALPVGTFIDDKIRKRTLTVVDPATGRTFADVRYEGSVNYFRDKMNRPAGTFSAGAHGFEGTSAAREKFRYTPHG